MARGENELIELIRKCYNDNKPLDNAFHERALDYYKEYLFVGGMPEAVEKFGKNQNTEFVRIIQQTIPESYYSTSCFYIYLSFGYTFNLNFHYSIKST